MTTWGLLKGWKTDLRGEGRRQRDLSPLEPKGGGVEGEDREKIRKVNKKRQRGNKVLRAEGGVLRCPYVEDLGDICSKDLDSAHWSTSKAWTSCSFLGDCGSVRTMRKGAACPHYYSFRLFWAVGACIRDA